MRARTIGRLWRILLWCAAAMGAQTVTLRLEKTQPLSRFSKGQLEVLAKLNHADTRHLAGFSRILVPERWEPDENVYSPMPRQLEQLASFDKALVVDLPAQVFGAYESGQLVRWGPVSSGDRRHTTPAGTYHLNWRARVRISSENPTWIMPWCFNFSATLGLSLHQFTLPGRPASHGCVRLLEADAKWLFGWGDMWTLGDGWNDVEHEGTLVLLIGKYDFTSPRPWMRPQWWIHGVSLELPRTE